MGCQYIHLVEVGSAFQDLIVEGMRAAAAAVTCFASHGNT